MFDKGIKPFIKLCNGGNAGEDGIGRTRSVKFSNSCARGNKKFKKLFLYGTTALLGIIGGFFAYNYVWCSQKTEEECDCPCSKK